MAIRDFSLEKTISTLEGKIALEGMESHAAVDMADIIPATACEMGTGSYVIKQAGFLCLFYGPTSSLVLHVSAEIVHAI